MILAVLLLCVAPQDGPARWHDHPESDALRYDVKLKVDPRSDRLEGSVEYAIRAVEALDHVRMDSAEGSDWSVSFETLEGAPLESERHGDELWVQLPQEVAPGGEIHFRAHMEGQPPDGFYFQRTRFGKPCAFTDHFPARTRGWLPCEDHPADRALFTLELEVPEGNSVICTGNGAWSLEGERRVWKSTAEAELPTYLLAVAVSPFAMLVEEGDARLAPHRVYAESVSRAEKALVHHGEWMRIMEETFGPFVYSKYCVVQVPTRWGGMEYPGNTWVMEGLFDSQRNGVDTLAHEFAHQWFGDAVGVASWSHVWLSEGFASYFGPWLDSQTGGPTLQTSMRIDRARWLRAPEGRRLPVLWGDFRNPGEILNQNAYPKGAWVLHMLRKEVGDEAFFGGVRDYYRSNLNHSVTTAALQQAMDKAAGRKLGWYFDQWLTRPGCPELRVKWEKAQVTIAQVQSGEPYRFPLTLQWSGADGKVHRKAIDVTESETVVPIEQGPPTLMQVDPDVELLFREGR